MTAPFLVLLYVCSGWWFCTTHALQEQTAKPGNGRLTSIVNRTGLPHTVGLQVTSKDAPLQTKLLDGSTVLLKVKDPKSTAPAYVVVPKEIVKNAQGKESPQLKSPFPTFETTTKIAEATEFIVFRFTDSSLNEWFSLLPRVDLRPNKSPGLMRVDPKTGKVFFDGDIERFKQDNATDMHWQLFGQDLDVCIIQNQATTGALLRKQGTTDVPVSGSGTGQESTFTAAWGIDAQNNLWQFDPTKQTWSNTNAPTTHVAVANESLAFRIDPSGKLHQWNGKIWQDISFADGSTRAVCCNSKGDVWAIADGILYHLAEGFWQPTFSGQDTEDATASSTKKEPPTWLNCACDDNDALWLVGVPPKANASDTAPKKPQIYFSQDGAQPTPVRSPDASFDPLVLAAVVQTMGETQNSVLFVSSRGGQTWRYGSTTSDGSFAWATLGTPLTCVSGNQIESLWGIDAGQNLVQSSNGTRWDAAPQPPSKLTRVARATGKRSDTNVPTEKKDNQQWLEAGFVEKQAAESATFGFEVVQMTQGGYFVSDPNTGVGILKRYGNYDTFAPIPLIKKPVIQGFSQDQVFLPSGSLITISRMMGTGVAWFGDSLSEIGLPAGRCCASFYSATGSQGGLHIVFGTQMTHEWVWRICLGSNQNREASIIKRVLGKDGVPNDIVVQKVNIQENPQVATQSGTLTPYWVSIDNGLLMVGRGTIGTNLLMVWRDPNPPTNINYVGVGTEEQPISFAQCFIAAPAQLGLPTRAYATTRGNTKLSTTTTWLPFTFRLANYGALGITGKNKGELQIRLASQKKDAAPHYLVSLGRLINDKPTLVCERIEANGQKKILGSILHESLLAKSLPDAAEERSWWISLSGNRIFIGIGKLASQNDKDLPMPIATFIDTRPLSGIGYLGFKSMGDGNLSLAQVTASIGIQPYSQQEAWWQAVRSLYLVMPFYYQFTQEGTLENASVKATDMITKQAFYAATLEPNTTYDFGLTLDAKGAPSLQWATQPKNPKINNVSRTFTDLSAQQSSIERKADEQSRKIQSDLADKRAAIQKKQDELTQLRTNVDSVGMALRTVGETVGGLVGGGAMLLGMQAQNSADEIVVKDKDGKVITQFNLYPDTIRNETDMGKRMNKIADFVNGKIRDTDGSTFNDKLKTLTRDPKMADAYSKIKKELVGKPTLRSGKGKAWWMAALASGSIAFKSGFLIAAAQEELNKAEEKKLKAEELAALKREEAETIKKSSEEQLKLFMDMQKKQAEIEQLLFEYDSISQGAGVGGMGGKKQDLATVKISRQAQENRKLVQELMAKKPKDDIELMNQLADALRLCTHSYVFGDQNLQDSLIAQLSDLDTRIGKGSAPHTSKQQLLELFARAYTNEFLAQADAANLSDARASWLIAISRIGRDLLNDPQNPSVRIPPLGGNYLWLSDPFDGDGSLTFEVQAITDLLVAFSSEEVARIPGKPELYTIIPASGGYPAKLQPTQNEAYEFGIGLDGNSRSSISLLPAKIRTRLYSKKQAPELMLNPLALTKFWFNKQKNVISMGKGQLAAISVPLMSWKDRYPIEKINYVGIGSGRGWVTVRNVRVGKAISLAIPKPAPATAPSTKGVQSTPQSTIP